MRAGRGHWEERQNLRVTGQPVLASAVHTPPPESRRKQDLCFPSGANLTLPWNAPVPRLPGRSRDLSAPAGPGRRRDEDRRDQNQQAESCLLPVPLPHLPEDVSRAKARQTLQETPANRSARAARTPTQPALTPPGEGGSPSAPPGHGKALGTPTHQQDAGPGTGNAASLLQHCSAEGRLSSGLGSTRARLGSARPAGKQPAQLRLPDSRHKPNSLWFDPERHMGELTQDEAGHG